MREIPDGWDMGRFDIEKKKSNFLVLDNQMFLKVVCLT